MSKALENYLRLPFLLLLFVVGVNCGGSRCQSRGGRFGVHSHKENNGMDPRSGRIDNSLMRSRPNPSVYSRSYLASAPAPAPHHFVPPYASYAPGMGVPRSYVPIGSRPLSGYPPARLDMFGRAYRPSVSRPAPGYFGPPPMPHFTGRSFAPIYSGYPSSAGARTVSHAGSARLSSAPSPVAMAPVQFGSAQTKSAERSFGHGQTGYRY